MVLGAALYDRGLTPGRTGNLSVRNDDEILITPTGSSLGRLDSSRLSVTSLGGEHRSGEPPSKELILHRALYRSHPDCRAVAHLHSPYAVAASCVAVPGSDALPAITPYFAMRVGSLPLVGYAAPGSSALEQMVTEASAQSRALLLSRHGSIATAPSIDAALDAVEEIEATARLLLILGGMKVAPLTTTETSDLRLVG